MLLTHGGIRQSNAVNMLEAYCAYWAAITHDFEHGGVNNDFLVILRHHFATLSLSSTTVLHPRLPLFYPLVYQYSTLSSTTVLHSCLPLFYSLFYHVLHSRLPLLYTLCSILSPTTVLQSRLPLFCYLVYHSRLATLVYFHHLVSNTDFLLNGLAPHTTLVCFIFLGVKHVCTVLHLHFCMFALFLPRLHQGCVAASQIRTYHPWAICYNDQSPLENHHLAAAVRFSFLAECRHVPVSPSPCHCLDLSGTFARSSPTACDEQHVVKCFGTFLRTFFEVV